MKSATTFLLNRRQVRFFYIFQSVILLNEFWSDDMAHEEKVIREQIVHLLKGGLAHKSVKTVLDEFPVEKINQKLEGVEYTPWQLLEHMRIGQNNILDFIMNPDYKSLNFPDDYWSDENEATEDDWENTKNNFLSDLNKLIDIAEDELKDLFEPITHAKDYNIYRELILSGNHNAYHLGQLALFNKIR